LRFFYNTELNQEVLVLPDGTIPVVLLHEVKALGMTSGELRDTLSEGYKKFLPHPEVSVIVHTLGGNKVYVDGEVGKPGPYEMTGPTTVFNAIILAGGMKDTARDQQVLIIRPGPNRQPQYISVDVESYRRGKMPDQDLYVRPFDIVFVPRSRIANVDLWFRQYLHETIGLPTQILSIYGSSSGGL
jgi:protein involved in polysaccharide export with SLBB domain